MTALELIKSVERYESLRLFIDDDDAQKVMAAWQLQRTGFLDRAPRKGETPDTLWESLWASIEPIQYKRLSDDAGVPYATACALFRRLTNARLIYPDGSISSNAVKLLTTEVGSRIAGMVPRGWSKRPASASPTPSTPSDTPSPASTQAAKITPAIIARRAKRRK